ncbi:5-oxoprolinase subunit PxpB [bacterium]|nr:5-oxoprolinase subunit PxpB [bacterium]
MQIVYTSEQAVVLSVSYDKTRDCVAAIRRMVQFIREHPHDAVTSCRAGLDSLLIEYLPDASFPAWLQSLSGLEGDSSVMESDEEVCIVPICYDFGYDIAKICAEKGLNAEEIIQIHSETEYQVWMIGFMPGFPYMGELPAQLQLERKKNPDPVVPAGSVAIAEEYVGIYPFDSPGGWHVIGRTPWKILDYSRNVPWIFKYGMKVRFQPISTQEYERTKQ